MIGGIGSAIGSFLRTTPGKVTAVAVGAGVIGGAAFTISRLLGTDKPASVNDAQKAADMVCDQGITGRQWCREATDMDYAVESSASGSESSMLSSEDSNGY